MIFLVVWIGFAVVTSLAAHARERSAAGWFFIGLLGGVFALLAVLVMKPGTAGMQTAAGPQAWPTARPAVKGQLISMRNGHMIHSDDAFFYADGRSFASFEAACAHVDGLPL